MFDLSGLGGIRTHVIPDGGERNMFLPDPVYNKDGTEKHVVCEGARHHVVSWDTDGEHCSEPNCEINRR